ncbi:hypothetical protein C8R45DRAFT_939784 [Mycena sanguinolenta]|nr:hypothetical protein C8R45DRAFT_939784 [Mycena sanguinolenta]
MKVLGLLFVLLILLMDYFRCGPCLRTFPEERLLRIHQYSCIPFKNAQALKDQRAMSEMSAFERMKLKKRCLNESEPSTSSDGPLSETVSQAHPDFHPLSPNNHLRPLHRNSRQLGDRSERNGRHGNSCSNSLSLHLLSFKSPLPL